MSPPPWPFPGGVGNTQGDADRFQQPLGDVSTKLFDVLPDDTWFYPGHGQRLDPRRRAAAPPGVARAGLVTSRA